MNAKISEVVTPAYLRPPDAARFLGVTVRTVRDWQRSGILAYSKPCRKVCLFATADLEKAMRRFRVQAVGE
jgi:predicted site-specific integrase-resolvase